MTNNVGHREREDHGQAYKKKLRYYMQVSIMKTAGLVAGR